jgi:CheY-like chemotaxis protein
VLVFGDGEIAVLIRDPHKMIHEIDNSQLSELRLLYVDAVESNHAIFKSMFEHVGVSHDIASSCEEAVRKSLNVQYDIIFIDCFSADIDGYVAARMIRDNERAELLEPALIFALKDKLTAVSQVKALDVGMDGVLLKPMTLKTFEALIVKWFGAAEVDVVQDDDKQGAANSVPRETLMDTAIALSLKGVLKDKYSAMVDLFKKDIQFYVDAAYVGVTDHDVQKVHHAMHTIKSASMQMGLVKVSKLAAQLEDLSRADNATMDTHLLCEIMRSQVEYIQHVYNLSEGMLEQTKS